MGILSIRTLERGKRCVCSSLRDNDAPTRLSTLANENMVPDTIGFGRRLYVLPTFRCEQGY
jgi:hypothetical protein